MSQKNIDKIKIYEEQMISYYSAVSMYCTLLFFMFQLLILTLPVLFLSMLTTTKFLSETIYIVLTILEIFLILLHAKKKFNFEDSYFNNNTLLFYINEKIVRKSFNTISVIGIICLFSFRASEGVSVLTSIISGFSVIYFIMFLIIRFIISKSIGYSALFSILLGSIQILFAMYKESVSRWLSSIF